VASQPVGIPSTVIVACLKKLLFKFSASLGFVFGLRCFGLADERLLLRYPQGLFRQAKKIP
jgi:hypothetical protein